MAANWFHTLTDKLFGRTSPRPQPSPGPTPRDRWLVPGIYFDTSGWTLADASASSMRWTNGPQTLTLTLAPRQPATAGTLDSLRRQQRALARAAGRDIVSVDLAAGPRGGEDIEVVTKRTRGLGFDFEGTRTVLRNDREYTIQIAGPELMTGMRESLLSAQLSQLGELKFDDVVQPSGGRRLLNWIGDPYDADFDDGALHCVSDDARLDQVLPDHPLTRIRAMLRRVGASLELDGIAASTAEPTVAGGETGPARPAMPLEALREVYWTSGRNDLLQAHLFDCLELADPRGESRAPGVARMLLMLGYAQHNSGDLAAARETFSRARDIFTASAGHRRETGMTLLALGRTQRCLDDITAAEECFTAAVALFDEEGDESTHLTMSLALLGEVLVMQDRHDDVLSIGVRLERMLEERPLKKGLASLHELCGGRPSGVTATIKVIEPR